MAILRSHHIALVTPDYPRAERFYTETLGFPIVAGIPGKQVAFLDIGGTTIELMGGPEPTVTQKPDWGLVHLAFEVDDVDATYAELAAKGVVFTVLPKSVGDIRLAFFTDPDGNVLELFRSPTITWSK